MTQRLETIDKRSETLDISLSTNLHREVHEERRRSGSGCHEKGGGKPDRDCRNSEDEINIELNVNIYECGNKENNEGGKPRSDKGEHCGTRPKESGDHKRDVPDLPKECGKDQPDPPGSDRSCWQRLEQLYSAMEQKLLEAYFSQRQSQETYVIFLQGDQRSQIARPIDSLLGGCRPPFPTPGLPKDFIPLPRPVGDCIPPPAPAHRVEVPPPAPAHRVEAPPPAPAHRADVPPPAPVYRVDYVPPPAPARDWVAPPKPNTQCA